LITTTTTTTNFSNLALFILPFFFFVIFLEREFWDKMEEYQRKSKREKKPKMEDIQKHIK